MPVFDDIETLESNVQKVFDAAEKYKSINTFRDAYVQSIIEAFGDFSNEELSTADIDKVVQQALKDSAGFIDEGLSQQINSDVSTTVNNTLDFYEAQGIVLPKLQEAVARRKDIQRLTEEFTNNMGDMREELLDGTIEAIKSNFAKGNISRSALTGDILEAADGKLFYARTNARMVVSGYNRIARDQVRQDAELEHGYYYGNVRNNTRTFCRHCVGQTFSLPQIKALDNGQGLDVKIYCGGWNCIHSWTWVDLAWDAELNERFRPGASLDEVKDGGLNLKIPAAA